MKNLLAVTALAVAMSTGAAFAQSNSGSDSGNSSVTTGAAQATDTAKEEGGMQFASEEERMMYTENAEMLAPFFTDESMATMRSDEEVKSAFEAMDAESQAGMKAACEKAAENRGSYGSVTNSLCDQVMAM